MSVCGSKTKHMVEPFYSLQVPESMKLVHGMVEISVGGKILAAQVGITFCFFLIPLIYPGWSEIVTMKFFGGLGNEEVALVMQLSPTTIKREWAVARLWLHKMLVVE